MKKTNGLKKMFTSGNLIRIAGAHNGLTAKLVEEAGFDGVWASGLEVSTSHALPDANILTMADFLQASENMADAVSIPVVSDCDTGFGNSNNVMHMVKKYESAGIAAVCIEDKKFHCMFPYVDVSLVVCKSPIHHSTSVLQVTSECAIIEVSWGSPTDTVRSAKYGI